jgi:hypothetical protein
VADLTARLGWPAAHAGRPPLRLAALTVGDGTRLLCAPVEERRAERLQRHAAAAGGTIAQLREALNRLWRLPWENTFMEPFWRLVYDAHPTAARLHRQDPCPCGDPAAPDHVHHYWTCPVAQAVQATITSSLTAANPHANPIERHHIWLALAPPGVHRGVWDVVCLAAVRAMDRGRRALLRETLAPPGPDDPPTPAALAARCGTAASSAFWTSLHSFASHRRIPRGWQASCPPGHPFLYYDPDVQMLTVHRPPGLQ